MQCEALSVFGLVENYGYGQVMGVRVAKYKAARMMLCVRCQYGYELEKDQWEQAKLMSKEIGERDPESQASESMQG